MEVRECDTLETRSTAASFLLYFTTLYQLRGLYTVNW